MFRKGIATCFAALPESQEGLGRFTILPQPECSGWGKFVRAGAVKPRTVTCGGATAGV